MRQRGDDHNRDQDDRDEEFGEAIDLESALIQRLRTMEWPKPTEEQRERCLREILAKMEEKEKEKEQKGGERYEASRFEARHEDRYPMNRRAADDQRYSSTRRATELTRQPISTPRQAIRLASSL
jgi:hypothetical protein